ncbi:MAG: hypothetical protein K6G65_06615 [Lachnospiraceae bacterium]|nr:hypothetical protein [Lachnospiraceae bacterium]
MEKDFNISETVERLRAGKKVKCRKCGKGYYVTNPDFITSSNNFWCDKCNDLLHIIPSVIVE